MNERLQSGALIPDTVVCDHSFALLGSVVRAMTKQNNLKEYINLCFDILFNRKSDKNLLPKPFIRIDYNHLVKIITS